MNVPLSDPFLACTTLLETKRRMVLLWDNFLLNCQGLSRWALDDALEGYNFDTAIYKLGGELEQFEPEDTVRFIISGTKTAV